MKKISKSHGRKKRRQLKYGSISVALVVLITVATIIANAIVSSLANGFGWYLNMNDSVIYGIGEECEEYIQNTILPLISKNNSEEKIQIILCDEEQNLTEDTASKYVFNTLYEFKEKFPSVIEISHLNIWENPTLAKGYGISSSTDVVFKFGDKHTTLTLAQFYGTTDGDTENPTSYIAEKRVASALLRIVSTSSPVCYFTINHGENISDSELMYLLADAGFGYSFLNLATDNIPDDCELLITVNPSNDLYRESSSSVISETDKLNDYMSDGGKYMFFCGADTFASSGLKNFEEFLAKWGIEFMSQENGEGNKNYSTLKDTTNSVSIDGLTFLGKNETSDKASSVIGDSTKTAVFGNACAIKPAENFKSNGSDGYTNGEKTFYPLIVANSTAEAWTNGRLTNKASKEDFTLVSLTEQKCGSGKTSYLFACSSISFCEEEALQSTVYGNSEIILKTISYMEYENIPVNLTPRPLSTPPIQSITRKQATTMTVLLCSIPTLAVAIAGCFVIIRRRRA